MVESGPIRARSTCRACNSKDLIPILSLGVQYVSDFVDAAGTDRHLKAPLELVLCNPVQGGCSLLQLRHTVSPDLLFKHYWYRSIVNEAMREALAHVCRGAEKTVQLGPGDLVLDIGCNDGTLLRSYGRQDLRLVGFEPARNLVAEAAIGTTAIINDFFNFAVFHKHFPDAKAKIVTSIAMFYDLEDPGAFVSDVARCLDNEGTWVIQMSYLPSMLAQNAFDNVCHEHLEYYSLASIQALLGRYGLRVFDAELNDVNGGSIRLSICHERREEIPAGGAARVVQLQEAERRLRLESPAVYEGFASRVKDMKLRLVKFISEETSRGKRVYAYGASTKGNTLLQYCGLDHTLIGAVADRNPDKWGKKTVGTMIPIISEAQARAEKPDYFLILPWHFLKGFKEREREFLERGGKFIVPLPELQIVGRKDD